VNNLNSILIEGSLARDALLSTTPKGTPVCTFSIVSNWYYKGEAGMEREVSFFDVEVWGTPAKTCGEKGRKGQGVRIVGRLRQDRCVDPQGEPQSRITIVAEHVEFRPDNRQENAKKGVSPCSSCPMQSDCDTEERQNECGAHKAYLEAKPSKKRNSTKKKA
jgi:single-strand DNA-binding protein